MLAGSVRADVVGGAGAAAAAEAGASPSAPLASTVARTVPTLIVRMPTVHAPSRRRERSHARPRPTVAERSQGWRQDRAHGPGCQRSVAGVRIGYWYEIMLGVGLRDIVCAGVSIGVSSS